MHVRVEGQYVVPDGGDGFLRGVELSGRPDVTTMLLVYIAGAECGQYLAVDFAVIGEGNAVGDDDGGGHHVAGEEFPAGVDEWLGGEVTGVEGVGAAHPQNVVVAEFHDVTPRRPMFHGVER